MPRIAALLVLFAIALLPQGGARAQVRHCIASDGTSVYTDRRCDAIGASDGFGPASPAAEGHSTSSLRNVCARSVQDLAYALDEAIRSGDANRIAGLYDWAGMGSSNAFRLMKRLQAVARRPLVDVLPMYTPGDVDAYGYDAGYGAVEAAAEETVTRKPRLVGLRVEQTLSNGSTPSHVVFGLRKHLGCWWVRL